MKSIHSVVILLSIFALAACGAQSGAPPAGSGPNDAIPAAPSTTHAFPNKAIQHLIIVVQEDRSFENLFAGFPNANAPTSGITHTGRTIALEPIPLARGPVC